MSSRPEAALNRRLAIRRKEILARCFGNRNRDHRQLKSTKMKKLKINDPSTVTLNPYRLCSNVFPTKYTLCIKPNFSKQIFEGCVAIECEIIQPTHFIMLNAFQLTIEKVRWIDDSTGIRRDPSTFTCDIKTQILKISFDLTLPAKSGVLYINFGGVMGDSIGIYYTKEITNGIENQMVLTQFEPADARRCFPCWDEPEFKAKFDISLIVPKNFTALSNMPVKTSIPHRKLTHLHVIEFHTTPPMSTYLVAFAIGDFEFIEKKTSTGVCLRAYTTSGKTELAEYALDYTAEILPIFEKFFEIPFPLPKLDLLALSNFVGGGMENWGLVFCHELALLSRRPEHHENVRIVVSHEIALMWFGNLLTMEWWDDLWLKEGFATYLEYLSLECLNCSNIDFTSSTVIWRGFVTDLILPSLEADSVRHNQSIKVSVNTPTEINEIYDSVSYSKAAGILRMLHNFIGNDFQIGIRLYLHRYQYQSTNAEDLWDIFTEVSGKSIVGDMMKNWTTHVGYPLIEVGFNYGGKFKQLRLTQRRFYAHPYKKFTKKMESGDDDLWIIPITISLSSDPTDVAKSVIMSEKSINITLPSIMSYEWILVNPGVSGYYRVHYSAELMSQLMSPIKTLKVPPIDRVYLLDNEFSMVKAGICRTHEVLHLLNGYVDEDDPCVWFQINHIMCELELLFRFSEFSDNFKVFGKSLYTRIYKQLGWNFDEEVEDSRDISELRSINIEGMLRWDNDECVEEALVRFLDYHEQEGEVSILDLPSEFIQPILSTGMASGGIETFNFMIQQYEKSSSAYEKLMILKSLGSSRDVECLTAALNFALTRLSLTDLVTVFRSVGENINAGVFAWEFFKNHGELLRNKFSGSAYLLHDLIIIVTECLCTDGHMRDVSNYFKMDLFEEMNLAVGHIIEKIHIKYDWLKRDMKDISRYFGMEK